MSNMSELHSDVFNRDRSTCWVWGHGKFSAGYGQVWNGKTSVGVHREAYKTATGEDITGLCILHKCDNPPCYNPDHLYSGTNADNVADRVARNRSNRGEQKHSAILTEDEVIAIRHCYAKGGITQAQIAEDYGVGPTIISFIISRKKWAHI